MLTYGPEDEDPDNPVHKTFDVADLLYGQHVDTHFDAVLALRVQCAASRVGTVPTFITSLVEHTVPSCLASPAASAQSALLPASTSMTPSLASRA